MADLCFDGKVVLVTGGARGIGAATAAAFEARGARVFRLDREAPRSAVSGFLQADVTQAGDVARAVAEAARLGGGLDVVVACAGITRDGVLWKTTEADWTAVLAVNLTGTFHLLHAAIPHLRARGAGSIVLVSSINGERGKFGQSSYAASKAGVIGLAKSAARELGAFHIRVNVVAPGWIDTEMTRGLAPEHRDRAAQESALGRVGAPEDVAAAILFLSSDLAAHVTGQVLRVDGGQYL
ncbi:MAG: SDR family oxidoreductase [Planctomycetes bacterium]|nr:SDR family oxidoreductase [Planctomycetota bacterium]